MADTIRCNELMWKIFDTKKMYEKFDFLRNRMMERKSLYLSSKDITSKEKFLFILLWLMPKLYYNLKLKQNSSERGEKIAKGSKGFKEKHIQRRYMEVYGTRLRPGGIPCCFQCFGKTSLT